jgi:hypothetical protein
MPITEDLIANETVLFESKKHWIAPVRDSLIAALMLLGAYLIGFITPDAGDGLFGMIGDLFGLIRLGLLIGGIGWIVYNIVAWRTAEFAVTSLRVIGNEGLLKKRSSATLLTAITDIRSDVGFLGKALGYGDLRIFTQSGDAGADAFTSMTDPLEFRNQVMSQKAGGAVAAAPVAAAPVAAAPVAAPPGPPTPSASDSADALARLADLHDRGAITDEEYEAKKTEILARM